MSNTLTGGGGSNSGPPTMVTGEERQAFAKLEALKEIRSKTIALEKLRLRLLHDVDAVESEDKCLAEFRREMDLLQQEKMAHVEELRQIHADINAMETVMKQAEEAKRQANESARRLLDDYLPLKHDVDMMRTELLGLEKLPELPNEEKERLGSIGLLDKPKAGQFDLHHPWHRHSALEAAAAEKAAAGFFGLRGNSVLPPSAGSSTSNPGGAAGSGPTASPLHHPHHQNPFLAAAAAQHSAMGLGPLGPLGAKADQLRTSLTAQAAVGAGPPPAPFRQQPPPMKSCLSCHQQIHRNAPICPLCKAKSRSRNPKKPKKKD